MEAINKKIVLNAKGFHDTLTRMAADIVSDSKKADDLVLVGIRTGGAILVKRFQTLLENEYQRPLPTGVIDINLYRDDWTRAAHKPTIGKTKLDFPIDDKRVVLVDDVLFTGRTVRAALDALMDFGRPARIDLAVLADRGHRELPICPNFTGLTIETAPEERVNVYFTDLGQEDAVTVERTG